MRLEQRFELPGAPRQTWPAFKDIELLVECLPGASLTGPPVDGQVPLRFDVKLGPISAGFAGTGRVSFDDDAREGCFEGSAADQRTLSRVKGTAKFSIVAHESDSLVRVDVDYSLSGSLAQFSRGGIVRALAATLTRQFAENLAARLQQQAIHSKDARQSDVPTEPRPSKTVTPLSGSSLVGQAIKDQWKRLRD